MPYNTSKRAVRRMMSYLQTLRENQGTDVTFTSQDPANLAYRIREALAGVEKHSGDFGAFLGLKDFFEFSVRPKVVYCRWIGERPAEEGIPRTDALTSMTISEATSLTHVVGAAMKFRDNADELFFPNAVLDDLEKEKLFRWTQSEPGAGWRFIDHEDGGTTLTRRDVDEDLLWQPPEIDMELIVRE